MGSFLFCVYCACTLHLEEEVNLLYKIEVYFYQPGAREAREPAGPKIALAFVCRLCTVLYMYVPCVRTYHVRSITSCVTMQMQSTTVITGL